MILYLDTTDKLAKIFLLKGKACIVEESFESSGILSEELLTKVDEILKKNIANKNNLFAIAVNNGPGSYTGVRIGVVTANSLGFALNCPVFAAKSKEELFDKSLKIEERECFASPVLPIYNYPPKITKKI